MSAVLETTPILESALRFAGMGLRCFPVDPVDKKAVFKGWQAKASSDPAQLARWFPPGTGHKRFGIAMGEERTCPATGRTQWATAIDLDLKDGKDGFKSIEAACKAAGVYFASEAAGTLCQGTPSGGGHAVFWCNVRLKNDSDVLGAGSGVDIRSRGGLILGAGSVNADSKVYGITRDLPMAVMSDALAAIFPLDAHDTKVADSTPIQGVDPISARAQAVEYLKVTPAAIEGQGGDRRTLDVAMRVLDFGCPQDEAVQLILEIYNPRCAPEWTSDEVVEKVCNAAKTRKDPPGILNTKAAFDAVLRRQDDPSTPATPSRSALVVTCVADVESKAIEWLWPQVFALGKHSTIAGDPGLGKSQVSIALAALVSTGGILPDGSVCPQGDVVFITAEDDVADTIRPRLEAAGADLRRVHVVDGVPAKTSTGQDGVRGFDLTCDVNRLAEMLDALPAVRLIVIDPASAFLGDVDSHKNAEVRAALNAITKLAEDRRLCLLTINHLNKGKGSAMSRVLASVAFVAQPRAAYVVTRDKDDPALRVMAPLKNNIAVDGMAFYFKVVSFTSTGDIETSRVEWQDRTEQLSADEALEQKSPRGGGAESMRAMDYVRGALAFGARPAREMEAGAKAAGISGATLRRARAALRVVASKELGKPNGAWVWALPEPPRTPDDIFA